MSNTTQVSGVAAAHETAHTGINTHTTRVGVTHATMHTVTVTVDPPTT